MVTSADAWEGNKTQDTFGLERQRRGWLYVHTSKVHSLNARYWKKMFIVLENDLTFYHGVMRDPNPSPGGMGNQAEGEEFLKSELRMSAC